MAVLTNSSGNQAPDRQVRMPTRSARSSEPSGRLPSAPIGSLNPGSNLIEDTQHWVAVDKQPSCRSEAPRMIPALWLS